MSDEFGGGYAPGFLSDDDLPSWWFNTGEDDAPIFDAPLSDDDWWDSQPDIDDVQPQEVDPPEWSDYPGNFSEAMQAGQDGYWIVDLSQIPEGYELRAQVFVSFEDAFNYLEKGGIIGFSTIIPDEETGVWRVSVARASEFEATRYDNEIDQQDDEIDF